MPDCLLSVYQNLDFLMMAKSERQDRGWLWTKNSGFQTIFTPSCYFV